MSGKSDIFLLLKLVDEKWMTEEVNKEEGKKSPQTRLIQRA